MKKRISIFLSFVMLISIISGFNLTANAATYYESEDNDSDSYADSVPVNSTIYGVCTDDGDYDWYKFTLNSPAKVNVNFSFTRADSDGWWYVCVYKYEGGSSYSELDYEYIYRYDGSYSFPSLGLPSGTYFIRVYSNYSASGKQYGVTPNCTYTSNWETEFNDDYTTADPLTIGTSRYGVCTYDGDYDWYKFTLSSAARIRVSFSHNKSTDGWWYVCIYKYEGGGSCTELDYEYIYCYDGSYTFPTLGLSSGTYFIRVYSNNSAAGLAYNVKVNYSVSTPSTLKVSTRNNTSLKLSWSKVSGASGYQLQQLSGDTYKTKATTSSTSATVSNLLAGKNYKFRVRAYKTVNGKKYYSSWKYLLTCTKPKTVTLSSLTTYSTHKIKASWKKVGGYASGYQIYWAKDKSFKNVVAKTTVSGQNTLSYTGKGFTKGRRYYVKVRAYKIVNGTKYYGSWSNVKSITCK